MLASGSETPLCFGMLDMLVKVLLLTLFWYHDVQAEGSPFDHYFSSPYLNFIDARLL